MADVTREGEEERGGRFLTTNLLDGGVSDWVRASWESLYLEWGGMQAQGAEQLCEFLGSLSCVLGLKYFEAIQLKIQGGGKSLFLQLEKKVFTEIYSYSNWHIVGS